MITMVAASTITALKIRNLAVFDAGTTSSESWLIAPSKLAWKIATSSRLNAVTLSAVALTAFTYAGTDPNKKRADPTMNSKRLPC
jgi:hypothetical protein